MSCSIKYPGLKSSQKSLLKDQYHLRKFDSTVLFIYLLTVSIKRPGLDFLKKSLLNDQYYLFFQILEA